MMISPPHRSDRSVSVPRSLFHRHGLFGRLLPGTVPVLGDPDDLQEAMAMIGDPGGPMDSEVHGSPPGSSILTGYTILGQFIDHDLSFDATSSLERQNDPEYLWNFRTPFLELDSLYGSGPRASPHLYDDDEPGKLLICGTEDVADLPRNCQGTALVGDPRNDQNQLISQLHLAFLKFHNWVFEEAPSSLGRNERFLWAQRQVRWHYQWIVLNEYLPTVCDREMITCLLEQPEGRIFHCRGEPFMPIEFSAAAFRFGHSQVRDNYSVNQNAVLKILNAEDDESLKGGRPLEKKHQVSWRFFFQFREDLPPKTAQRINTRLAEPLLRWTRDGGGRAFSLATRNLRRGLRLGLPSGQSAADKLGIEPLGSEHFEDLRGLHPRLSLESSTPLWFYILREAENLESGQRLGPMGARIVAETLVGLLAGDPFSYLGAGADWRPIFGEKGDFTMVDLLRRPADAA